MYTLFWWALTNHPLRFRFKWPEDRLLFWYCEMKTQADKNGRLCKNHEYLMKIRTKNKTIWGKQNRYKKQILVQ